MTDSRTWLVELLEALERLSQLTQQNTAAVNNLRWGFLAPTTPMSQRVQKIETDLAEQLERAAEVIKRLQELQVQLTQESPDGTT